jgi:hypothetical protein
MAAWIGEGEGGEGKDDTGNGLTTRMVRIGGSGECGPIAAWDPISHTRSASLDPGDYPRGGGGEFPEWKPSRGAHQND